MCIIEITNPPHLHSTANIGYIHILRPGRIQDKSDLLVDAVAVTLKAAELSVGESQHSPVADWQTHFARRPRGRTGPV